MRIWPKVYTFGDFSDSTVLLAVHFGVGVSVKIFPGPGSRELLSDALTFFGGVLNMVQIKPTHSVSKPQICARGRSMLEVSRRSPNAYSDYIRPVYCDASM